MRVLRIGEQVGKMDYLTIQHGTPGRSRAVWPRWIRLEKFIQDFGRKIVGRRNFQKFAIMQPDNTEYGLAQARGALNDRIEHRLSIRWRPTDDAEDLAGRGLMLQRFRQLARARLHLVEESHILDRDHRLVGEGCGELNLLAGEGPRLCATDYEAPDRLVLSQQRDGEDRPVSSLPERQRVGFRELVALGSDIADMYRLALQDRAPGNRRSCDGQFDKVNRNRSMMSPKHKRFALSQKDHRVIGIAQPRCRFHQRIEHRLQIERRPADHLEHVGGGGLLLQRLPQLVEQAGVLDGDDGLCGEVLDKLDLLVAEWLYLLPINVDRADRLILLDHRDAKYGAIAGKPD